MLIFQPHIFFIVTVKVERKEGCKGEVIESTRLPQDNTDTTDIFQKNVYVAVLKKLKQ